MKKFKEFDLIRSDRTGKFYEVIRVMGSSHVVVYRAGKDKKPILTFATSTVPTKNMVLIERRPKKLEIPTSILSVI